MRTLAVSILFSSFVLASPALAQVPADAPPVVRLTLTPAQIAKLKQQIGLHEQRAKELQPLLARDVQARQDFLADVGTLGQNAKDMRTQAAELRASAPSLPPADRDNALAIAKDLETFAVHDDADARTKRELATKLEALIKSEQAAIQLHLDAAAKLKTFLATNS